MDAHRKKGLATMAAAVAIEAGLKRGLERIVWTCAESNIGSIRIAEKLGLERQSDYTAAFINMTGKPGMSQQAYDLAEQAYVALQCRQFAQTLECYQQFFGLVEEPPVWAYLDMARAWAGMGNTEKALIQLKLAQSKGWSELGDLGAGEEFSHLKTVEEWQALLQTA